MKISFLFLLSFSFGLLLSAQPAHQDCTDMVEKPDTDAVLPAYAEMTDYDQDWFTKSDIAKHIHTALEPRDTSIMGRQSDLLSFTVTKEGILQDFAFAKEKNNTYLPLVQNAMTAFTRLRAATLAGEPVCSRLSVNINFQHLKDPASDQLMREFIYQMPVYNPAACADLPQEEQEICGQRALLMDLYKNIKYPPIARENGVEGTVVIYFVVNQDGTASHHRIVRDIGGGCGQESLRVIQQYLQNWAPGLDENKEPVRVAFHLPVRFKLEGRVKKKRKN